jgi:pilus assembly protein Flp/PilA
MSLLRRLSAVVERVRRSDEDGQGLAEYALILALIAIVAIIGLIFLGSQVSDKLSVIGSTLESVQN